MSTDQTPVPITSQPAAGQLVEHEGKTYETVKEGKAYILIPPNTQKHVDPQAKAKTDGAAVEAQKVFYNPIQQFNRDLSVLAIKAFGEDWMQRKKAEKEKNKGRNERKKSKKRKRADVEGDRGDGGAKLTRADDGSAVAQTETNGTKESEQVQEADAGASLLEAVEEQEPAKTNGETEGESAPTNGHATQPSGPRFRILDALSASGLRALRYAKEIPFVTSVVANDMSSNAIKSMKLNIKHNGLESAIETNTGDAIGHMYSVAYPPTNSHGPKHVSKKYDVIDLDPYGTAAPFVDAALQSLNDGGLLCVTCTDSGVFASTGYCEKTYSLYGGMPVKGPYMHEGGLRLVINSIATSAAKYGMAIEPLLSLSIDFYARVFIRVRRSPADVKFLAGKTMLVYSCDQGCGAWTTNMLGRNTHQVAKNNVDWYKHSIAQAPNADRHCDHCGTKTHLAGPMWGGLIHNAAFIEKMLQDVERADKDVYETTTRIEGMLTTALDELAVNNQISPEAPASGESKTEIIPKIRPEVFDNHPFFFNPSALAKVIHCQAPSDAAMKGALRKAGYIASRSHCQPGSIKTDAPWSAIWEIMREWARQKAPIKEGALKETTAGWRIMQSARKEGEEESGEAATEYAAWQPPKNIKRFKVVFDEVLGKDKPGKRLIRYQQNPRENWGPMTKAKGSA